MLTFRRGRCTAARGSGKCTISPGRVGIGYLAFVGLSMSPASVATDASAKQRRAAVWRMAAIKREPNLASSRSP